MGISFLMILTSPVTWLLVAALASVLRRGGATKPGPRRLGIMRGAAIDVGAAFMFLSVAYRPNHAFLVKAQIRQVEDVDEDDQGGPETPARQLHRQLRRIRRGEPVRRLVYRLE